MQVFKFGGASVKDAANIKNVTQILSQFKQIEKVVVVSAIGKTTNALESLIDLYARKMPYLDALEAIYKNHLDIAQELGILTLPSFHKKMEMLLDEVKTFLSKNTDFSYTFVYDQVVPLGELFSSTLLQAYVQTQDIASVWIDARTIISTNNQYTEAKVNFALSEQLIQSQITKSLLQEKLIITQGFIGKNEMQFSTTLGREGSDYTASVLAFCLDAEKVVIWKDVPAVLNADPRLFDDAIAINQLSYREAIEMTYYGAQVIHPKTIKPLQNKHIPLQVRSFIELDKTGTMIGGEEEHTHTVYPPIIVYKTNQALISISVKDFSFVTEDNLSIIFQAFSEHGLRMNMTHSGAISFSVCTEFKEERIKALIQKLEQDFEVKYNTALELLTIRHYTEAKIAELTANKEILLQQKTRNTIQILMRKKVEDSTQ